MKNICKLLCALCCVAVNCIASPLISEVMYSLPGDDTGREWTEVANASTIPLQLTNWFLYENGVNHRIRAVTGLDIVPAGGVALICSDALGFLTDNPGFSGNLFESSFELSNTGETISLRDHNKNTVDAITYSSSMGGNGDGNSLHRVGASLVAMAPTPGTNPSLSIIAFLPTEPGKAAITISELVSGATEIKFSSDLVDWFTANVTSSEENKFHVLLPEAPQCFFRVVKPNGN